MLGRTLILQYTCQHTFLRHWLLRWCGGLGSREVTDTSLIRCRNGCRVGDLKGKVDWFSKLVVTAVVQNQLSIRAHGGSVWKQFYLKGVCSTKIMTGGIRDLKKIGRGGDALYRGFPVPLI